MSSSSSISVLDDFDYIHLKAYDIHGVPKGRLVTRKAMNTIVKRGMGIYAGALYCGVRGEPNLHDDFVGDGPGNIFLVPNMSTLTPCTRTSRGKYKVGEVICYTVDKDGKVDHTTPRELALAQLSTLREEFGLVLKSTFEIECKIINRETGKYLGQGALTLGAAVFEAHHDLFLELCDELKDIGVNVDAILKEESDGEYEFTVDISTGIDTADQVAKFKSASKLFFDKRGYDIVFMTVFKGCCLGAHFNVSLWTPDDENAFLDNGQPNNLSKTGQHFLAGLVEHGQAMASLVCPTVNCYRRFGEPWAPEFSNWGLDDRYTTFRLKSESDDNVYIENRLPSGACNPYLAMAATLAAGMDGMRRKLPLPKPKQRDASIAFPKSLDKAYELLRKDTTFMECLGETMVNLMIYTKKTFEIDVVRALGIGAPSQKVTEKEMELYYKYV